MINDPSGEDIPRSLKENLEKMGCTIELDRILLLEEDVIEMDLPPAPAKLTDSRTANWDGLGQVELDAVEPKVLQKIIRDSILNMRDESLYEDLKDQEAIERVEFKEKLKEFVQTL